MTAKKKTRARIRAEKRERQELVRMHVRATFEAGLGDHKPFEAAARKARAAGLLALARKIRALLAAERAADAAYMRLDKALEEPKPRRKREVRRG